MKLEENIKNGIGFGIGLLVVMGMVWGIYAFVEPSVAPSGNNYVIDSDSTLLKGGGWQNCEVLTGTSNTLTTITLSCSAGKSIRDISHSCSATATATGAAGQTACGLTSVSTTSITGRGDYLSGYFRERFTATIICCDD